MIKCITFDVTNTLVYVASAGNVALHYSNVIRNRFEPNFLLDIESANKNFKKYFKYENEVNPGYGYSKGMQSREWWSRIVKQVIKDNLEAKNTPNLFDSAKLDCISGAIYDEFKKEKYWQKYADCDFVLDELKQTRGLKLGIVSNFDERLPEILKNLNLLSHFDFVCIPSNSNGFAKPSQKIFMSALHKSGCQNPEELLHVGDSFELDYTPATALNFKSVLLKHLNGEKEKKDFLKKVPDRLLNQADFAFSLKDIV
ncbi:haloacid dehalogenase-like hydrolase domain-containing 3 [Brachionus plicatilis]|uniref:Haloacid dehalogenase-like hydrolase domain-containing 3 n=1 Tax=Brachionus plicatilis TaxID=10195 RepID=A0A3M7ST63_BRAPC|nr:haloacid dehalogenase-like hydrolase domain-containing 3 [Brachionus plicatilis]